MESIKSIQVFNEIEEDVITKSVDLLKISGDGEQIKLVENSRRSLNLLAESISQYPSLLDQQMLGKHSRSLETLVENLCLHPGLNLLLNTPTKAVLGRAFTVAKMNFFILIYYLCTDQDGICQEKEELNKIVSLNVFSIMAEEVFISIISDKSIDRKIRQKAGFFLARIWEYRIYRGMEELEPVLTDLWISRFSFNPTFGTMEGITEITSFCSKRNPLWIDFLNDGEFSEDILDALKEYLMGLTYEEIVRIEDYMQANSISSLRMEAIDSVLQFPRSYSMTESIDPREMYHFYVKRKNNSMFRKKSCMRGPQRTIEEYIIYYMLKHGMIKSIGE